MYIAVVGERCPEGAVSRLLSLSGVAEVIRLPRDTLLPLPIADHPDSLICIFEEKLYVHESYSEEARDKLLYLCRRCGLELLAVGGERGREYPLDCGLNALALPSHHLLIGRRKSLAEPLRALANGDTRQGYAACTALFCDGCIITADPAIIKTAERLNVPTHKISGKGISLPGYNEGFIGGAGGFFEKTVCLFGSPEHSESAREVACFCKARGLSLISLEDGPLTDRGGVKFVEIKQTV